MTEAKIAAILKQIEELKNQKVELDPLEYTEAMEALLRDLLPYRGLSLYSPEAEDDPPVPPQFDALVLPGTDAGPIPVLFERSNGVTTDVAVKHLIKTTAEAEFGESLLIIRGSWDSSAWQARDDYDPDSVHLADLGRLGAWARNPAALTMGLDRRARALRRTIALDIANDPRALDEIEWRDLERVINEVLAGLNYGVHLTPGSKDGGKDLIIHCLHISRTERYYIEVKHWRSGVSPGEGVLKKFAKVLNKDGVKKGLVLSSSGFAGNARDNLTAEEAELIACGDEKKIFALCQYYKLLRAGIGTPPKNPAELLFMNTTSPLLVAKAG
jgi:hypothetical protein